MNIKQIAQSLADAEKELTSAKLKKAIALKEAGHAIRRRRMEKRMQLTTFAKRIGRSQAMGCFIENGTAKLTAALLRKIGEVLK